MRNKNRMKLARGTGIAIFCLMLLLAVFACQVSTVQQAPTPSPLPAATDKPIPTNTPIPTDTPTPTDTPIPTDTPTLEPSATPTEDLAATQSAMQTQASEAALAQVLPELERIGISAEEGHLAWAQVEPVSIMVDTFDTLDYAVLDPDLTASDFVIHSEITWDSTGGYAVCGIIMRADEDIELGAQYRFQTIRLSGWPSWDVERWKFDRWVVTASNIIVNSRSINQENGAKNRYTIIAKGSTFSVYVNDDKPKNVVDSALKEGIFAFMAWQESGETTCVFENSWVYALNTP